MSTRTILAHLSGITLALFFSTPAFPVDRTAESRWTHSPIVVDGRGEEWQTAELYSEKKPALGYAFQNDARNLYILLVFENAKSLGAVEATGMAIYYSPEGTNEKINGTRFIKEAIPVDRFILLLESQGKVLTEEDKGFLRTRFQYPVYEAYAIDREGKYAPAAPSPPGVEPQVFGEAKKENLVTYEFRIPLAPRRPQPAELGSQPAETVKVGFEWGGSAMKILSTKTSWHSPQSLVSGDVFTGSGETRAQEFLSSFDRLSRPSLKTQEYAFWVDVRLAPNP
jgi:hypothetical protein